MIHVPSWLRALVLLILVGGILVALPNALSDKTRARFPHWLPANTVNLGLDLQGGSYLLLQVDLDAVQKDKTESLMGDINAALRKADVARGVESKGDTVTVRIKDAGRFDEARTLVQGLNPAITGSVLSVGGKEYDFSEPQPGTFVLHMTDAYKAQTRQQVMDQSVEVIRRRIDALGTKEPDISRSGDDRILVQVPGLQDPTQLKLLLGKTAKMTFRLVDEGADANATIAPIGDDILPVLNETKGAPPQKMVVHRRVVVSGDRLVDASQGFSTQTGQPIVNFRFDSLGAKQFADVTTQNEGHLFAIVLDNQIITAPKINGAILGGSGYIEGSFTTQTANNLAILLRAGALPAPLHVIEERTVGAELGADSVKAGRISALAGLGLVALFMVLRYGLFGIFADIALTLNMVLLLATLTLFNATLTLPGIAGIVLTMGMAVDANVLIFERIREEQRNGRGMLAAIDHGFQRARATIIDANATHLIASLILFGLGTGPVKGFAVTLAVGIITSFFTAVMVTRLIVVTWLNATRPKKLVI